MNERFAEAKHVARVVLAREPDFSLGAVRVRPSLYEVVGDGWSQTLEPRVMQVLVALRRAGDQVVSRDDLIEACWEGRIVGEDAITRCIGRLRKLAATSDGAFVIDTVSHIGYHLRVAENPAVGVQASTEAMEYARHAEPVTATGNAAKASERELPRRSIGLAWLGAVGAAVMFVGFAIWWFWPRLPPLGSSPPPGLQTSVAVLPFVNMSGDPSKEYFSDGFSEELVNDLSNNPHLRVASRTSSFVFKGRNQNIETIARTLRVHAIVEGSVRESGNRVRVTAQLVSGIDGYHLWSAVYDRNLTDILSVQDELARAVAAALTHRLLPTAPLPRPKIDPAVYRLYLQGVHDYDAFPTPENWQRAFAIFNQVIRKAPEFADGFAWLSRAALNLAVNNDAAPAADFARASDAAQRALSLDPHNVMARVIRATVELDSWDWRGSASDLRILRNENPSSYFSIAGLWNYYSNMGFQDQALATWRRLYGIDPNTYNTSFLTPVVFYQAGRLREEVDATRAILVNQPRNFDLLSRLCRAYAETGRVSDARAIGERLRGIGISGDSRTDFEACAWEIDLVMGNLTEARRLLQVWEAEFPDKGLSAGNIGTHWVRLGDYARASDWFGRAYERREYDFFRTLHSKAFENAKALENYRMTAEYKSIAQKPLFKEWQAEHDRIAAALAAHRDPLALP